MKEKETSLLRVSLSPVLTSIDGGELGEEQVAETHVEVKCGEDESDCNHEVEVEGYGELADLEFEQEQLEL